MKVRGGEKEKATAVEEKRRRRRRSLDSFYPFVLEERKARSGSFYVISLER